MINHIRNLLLNDTAAASGSLPAPWDRYMAPDFVPRELPEHLENIRFALVGGGDWWTRTLRVETILRAIFSSRYSSYYDWYDDRGTDADIEPFNYPFVDVLRPVNEFARLATGAAILKYGEPAQAGVRRRWTLTVKTGPELEIEIDSKIFTRALTGAPVKLSDDIGFVVSTAGLLSGAIWTVESYTKPAGQLTAVFAAMPSSSNDSSVQLFLPGDPEDQTDLDTFKRWFVQSTYEMDKLAGLVFAYVRKATKIFLKNP